MSYVSADLPRGATRTTFEVAGGALSAVQLGPQPSAGAVLLLPGFSGSKEDFGPLLPLLAPGGRRVVALDLRGQYESAGPDDPAAYTVDALADDVLAVLARLDGPVHLVGHSFGGFVARAAALRDPSALVSLTLMSSGPEALVGPRVDVLALLPAVIADGGMTAVADASAALAEADPAGAGAPAHVTAFLRGRWLASSPTGLLAMADALTAEPDRVDALRATGLPVLVLHGADDDAWSPATQAEMAHRLGAAYEVVPGARHSPAVEAPEATADALLRFWA